MIAIPPTAPASHIGQGCRIEYGVSNSSDSWQSRMRVCIQSSQFDPDGGPPPTVLSDEKATSTLLKMFFSVSRNAEASGSSL